MRTLLDLFTWTVQSGRFSDWPSHCEEHKQRMYVHRQRRRRDLLERSRRHDHDSMWRDARVAMHYLHAVVVASVLLPRARSARVLNIESRSSQKLHAAMYNVCAGEPMWTYGATGHSSRARGGGLRYSKQMSGWTGARYGKENLLFLYCFRSCFCTQVREWNAQVPLEQLSLFFVFFFFTPLCLP